MPTPQQITAVYVTLGSIAIVISALLITSMVISYKVFITIFMVYLTGCFAYIFAIFIIKRNEVKKDVRYNVGEYITLFNMILCVFLFIIGFLVPKISKSNGDLKVSIDR
jgi:hypothetical protein